MVVLGSIQKTKLKNNAITHVNKNEEISGSKEINSLILLNNT